MLTDNPLTVSATQVPGTACFLCRTVARFSCGCGRAWHHNFTARGATFFNRDPIISGSRRPSRLCVRAALNRRHPMRRRRLKIPDFSARVKLLTVLCRPGMRSPVCGALVRLRSGAGQPDGCLRRPEKMAAGFRWLSAVKSRWTARGGRFPGPAAASGDGLAQSAASSDPRVIAAAAAAAGAAARSAWGCRARASVRDVRDAP